MTDPRCCGSGTCIINADGECWCGQVWDGKEMLPPYYINESGLRVNKITGDLLQGKPVPNSQILPP